MSSLEDKQAELSDILDDRERGVLATAVMNWWFRPARGYRAACERLVARGLLDRVSCKCGSCTTCNGTFKENLKGRKALFGED